MKKISPIRAFYDNYIWLLEDGCSNFAAVVDPGDARPVLDTLRHKGLTLSAILITHHHADHCGGVKELLKHFQVPVFAPKNDSILHATDRLKENDCITIPKLEMKFTVLEVPGHTSGHIAYYGEGVVFCGDTLFSAGCGRVFEGTAKQMLASLQKFSNLPEDTAVYCAHEYTLKNLNFAALVEPNNEQIKAHIEIVSEQMQKNQPSLPSTIGLEKQINPFLRTHMPNVQEAAMQHAKRNLDSEVEIFAAIRHWKDNF